jgi:excisionase family DNA binding protein
MASDIGVTPSNRRSGLSSSSGEVGEMLTAKELERLLKISVKTLYRYVQRGLIPYVRIRSNVRFPKQQILEWIARQSYRP